MSEPALTLQDIYRARAAIAGSIRRTPTVASPTLSAITGVPVYLKLEQLQETGAFKLRGALNRLAALSPEEQARGVVTMSTGNHGRGVATAARKLGARAVICMSRLVPANKVEAIRALGADIRIVGDSQDEAEVEARRLVADEGLVMVSPFDDTHIVAGQGTIGLEILEDLPEVGTVLVPVSGGGLAGGIALAVKTAAPRVRVVGISMDRGAAMYESLKAGHPVAVTEVESLADSLGGGIGLDNRLTFALMRDLLDDLILVSEDEIAAAMRHAYWAEQQIVEGGGAVGIAVLRGGRAGRLPGPVLCLLSGRNVDMARFTEIVAAGPAAAPAGEGEKR
ncbi:MAG: hydroxyectoine utilization dehydratase EutB [Alphaproteobacteria bacterium]|nr:hydroxyectoine utilization dehydratase EutB [Alphaproteobacteria bacterium]